jgi:sialic acid synthase SpsE
VAARLREMKEIFEKSVVTVAAIPAGAVIAESMVAVKKPGTGIPARLLPEVIGRRTRRAVPADTLLREEDLDA